MRTSPGLSSFVDEPGKAGESLGKLIAFAEQNVGQNWVGSTEIRLMATAGLRMVDREVREEILKSCRSVLRGSGFKFQDDWASVIPGCLFVTSCFICMQFGEISLSISTFDLNFGQDDNLKSLYADNRIAGVKHRFL